MPTPFTHLQITDTLLHDAALSPTAQRIIRAEQPAFLLGGVVADARPPGSERADTHFYHYTRPMPDNPWREMFRQHPSLQQSRSQAHRAFLMGYVAHLATDEFWSRYMLAPYFANGNWGRDIRDRFYVLHMLLIAMDERDEALLAAPIPGLLRRSQPHEWLPFMADEVICEWRDFIAQQLQGESKTIEIFGSRINTSPQEIRARLDDPAWMQERLWDNITRDLLRDLEAKMYAFSREQVDIYLQTYS